MVLDGVVALNNESSNVGIAEGGIEMGIGPVPIDVVAVSSSGTATSIEARSSTSTPVILNPPALPLLKLRIELGLEVALCEAIESGTDSPSGPITSKDDNDASGSNVMGSSGEEESSTAILSSTSTSDSSSIVTSASRSA